MQNYSRGIAILENMLNLLQFRITITAAYNDWWEGLCRLPNALQILYKKRSVDKDSIRLIDSQRYYKHTYIFNQPETPPPARLGQSLDPGFYNAIAGQVRKYSVYPAFVFVVDEV